jgi:hypothetical protein
MQQMSDKGKGVSNGFNNNMINSNINNNKLSISNQANRPIIP